MTDTQDLERMRKFGAYEEQQRILKLLLAQDIIRRDALGFLVAFNTHGTEVVYIQDLEGSKHDKTI